MDELTLNTGLGSGQNISATLSGSQNSNQSVFRNFDDLFIFISGKQRCESCKSKHSMHMKPYSLSFKTGSDGNKFVSIQIQQQFQTIISTYFDFQVSKKV